MYKHVIPVLTAATTGLLLFAGPAAVASSYQTPVNAAGRSSADFPEPDKGQKGFSGWERVVSPLTSVAPGQLGRVVEVSCGEGKRVLGGGHIIESGNRVQDRDVHVVASRPNEAGNAWQIGITNLSAISYGVKAYAICANVGQ
ncbi:hypothetical protein [Nonomuraea dietziae]|uniref:Secreted protein n=1 Tax=Nonomuraea dietziae TaxID=65515 RepID=A0A7W5V2S7_9ACTN|nr:hypothetical protein [Nonomuraea dietziae]MBB3724624.1 hypothetical protein [Nonomuraea dietziae]